MTTFSGRRRELSGASVIGYFRFISADIVMDEMSPIPHPLPTPKLAPVFVDYSVDVFDGHSEPLDVYVASGESECIRSAGYIELFRALYVDFHDGSRYRYSEVRPSTFIAMTVADSPGEYFNASVRGRHHYRRIRTADAATVTQ